MENTIQERKIKKWKIVIIIHGILCFLLVYLSPILMFMTGFTPWEFYIELVREIITDPSELFFM